MVDRQQLEELLLQSLEHERGGVKVYQTAVECAQCEDLKKEWTKYLDQTRRHVQILEGVFKKFEIDPEKASPGRQIVADLGAALAVELLFPTVGECTKTNLRAYAGRRALASWRHGSKPRVVA